MSHDSVASVACHTDRSDREIVTLQNLLSHLQSLEGWPYISSKGLSNLFLQEKRVCYKMHQWHFATKAVRIKNYKTSLDGLQLIQSLRFFWLRTIFLSIFFDSRSAYLDLYSFLSDRSYQQKGVHMLNNGEVSIIFHCHLPTLVTLDKKTNQVGSLFTLRSSDLSSSGHICSGLHFCSSSSKGVPGFCWVSDIWCLFCLDHFFFNKFIISILIWFLSHAHNVTWKLVLPTHIDSYFRISS